MNLNRPILLLLSCLYGILCYGQNIEFIENKGQWNGQVRFTGQIVNGAFYIHNNGYTVVQTNQSDQQKLYEASHRHSFPQQLNPLTLRSHAYRVQFVGASTAATIIPDKPLPTYSNYFIGNDPSKWASDCKSFQAVTVSDIYPHIDVRYYTDDGIMKYDFIVRPGGKVSDIVLDYNGANSLKLKDKELVIGTSVGELREMQPYSYQYGEKGRQTVTTRFTLKGSRVSFDVKNYDPNATLIIDPALLFCSFTGSKADNWGFSATYGPDGSMFGGGIVFNTGFPVTTGAFQTNFGGGAGNCSMEHIDIGIIKLSPDGSTARYATYLGGSGAEWPQSLIVDAQGELVVAGRTTSSNYPLKGAGKTGPGGLYDISITKFNAAGTDIIGSVVIGGTNDDGANINPCGGEGAKSLQQNYGDEARSEVNLDAAGNIYLASCTQSSGTFPVTANAFQKTFGGGKQDGVVLKYNSDLSSLLFASYYGGSANDAAYVLSLSPSNQIYIAGGTESNDLKGTLGGVLGSSAPGGIDGFVATISNDGTALIRTTYVGTNKDDQVYGLQFDRNGFPYVMGQTTGTWPIINANYNQPNGRQFIAKLRPDLSAYVYSTAFGKSSPQSEPDISPVAFLVDRCENVYVSGWGGKIAEGFPSAGVAGLPVTADAIKSNPDVNTKNGLGEDFYFFVLKKDAARQLYGSFFGQNGGPYGDHVDGGTSRFDRDGVIYQAICASCETTAAFPTTPGVWAPLKPGSAGCNLAMVKIDFQLAGIRTGILSTINGQVRDTAGCVPLTVDFTDTVQTALRYVWNFGDGSPLVNTTTPSTSHTFNNIGIYRVMLVGIDSTSCNVTDTSYINIRVGNLRADLGFVPVKLNPCDAFRYRFDNTSVAPGTAPFKGNSFTWDFGDGTPKVNTGTTSVNHEFRTPGTYNVRLILTDTTYCNAPDTLTLQLRVAALVKAKFETPARGCAPYTAVFNNTSEAGSNFTWDFGDGTTSNAVSPVHVYPVPGTYRVSLIAEDTSTCNKIDSTSFTITVFDIPTADYSASPQPPVLNTPISFTNLSSPDAVRFKWLFGDGDSLVTTSRTIVQHEYNATKAYNACLIAINPAGCADTVCKEVRMLIEPAVDVPTAFTPGKGGTNSVVYVRGFGIAKMTFTVWARWGEKVFETNTKTIGWDGRFKGSLLPTDVYAYTLQVEFTDGTKTTKTGDITLIR